MANQLKIDIVSDVVCPWCIIGYKRLQQAISELKGEIEFDIEWHPFELNPHMPAEGQDAIEHITQKYGRSLDEMKAARAQMAAIGEQLGFHFYQGDDRRVYNSFDAHRLLHWAKSQHKQTELKLALFAAYFTHNLNISSHEVLLNSVEEVGLDKTEAADILASDQFKKDVQEELQRSRAMGIQSVPSYIINQKYLLSGARESQDLVAGFRQIASEAA
ncbi:DsbA family oxidoreductase [Alteromonadaceae bacterium M269]|nr:DsbA family oxidoreductase [Alteromonadaceae bacterium M269]